MSKVKEIHISAKAGDPSTLWQNTGSNRYYRTKAEAETDDATKAVNPADYSIEKTFWQKHGKKVLIGLGIVILVAVVWYVSNPKAAKKVNPFV